jgi:hypothetical protein
MRYLKFALLAFLMSGCAEYFGSRIRMASMEVRLPATTATGIADNSSRASEIVGEVVQRYGLSSVPPSRPFAGNNLYVIPGHAGGPWPGQPDVDWNGGASWTLAIIVRTTCLTQSNARSYLR